MISDCIIRTMLNNFVDSVQVLKHMEMHTHCVLTTVHLPCTPCTLTSDQPSTISPQALLPQAPHLRSAQCTLTSSTLTSSTLTSGQPCALSVYPHLRSASVYSHSMHSHLSLWVQNIIQSHLRVEVVQHHLRLERL